MTNRFEDVQLSKDFCLSEFVISKIAEAHGIDNTPGPEHIDNLRALSVHLLQPLRNILGRPVSVSSGYRCPEVNKLVGGKPNSQHQALRREAAADIYVQGMSANELFEFVISHKDQLNYDQAILEAERGVVHLSFKRGRGMDITRLT